MKAVCVGEKRNNSNVILGYHIQVSPNNRKYIDKATLKNLIKENKLSVANLKLTSDNRLVKVTINKTLENSKLNERLAKIEQKVISDKKAEQINKDKDKAKAELASLIKQIEALTPRIEALLILANKCRETDVHFPWDFLPNTRYPNRIGFVRDGDAPFNYGEGPYIHLAIFKDARFDRWNFYTSGNKSFFKNAETGQVKSIKKDTDETSRLRLKEFLAAFPAFEESFNKWIDSLS